MAQHIAEYLSKMNSLQRGDPADVWKQLYQGNVCVKKTDLAFCSLGVDHALEKDYKRLKVLGGLKCIMHKPAALERFFHSTSELENIILGREYGRVPGPHVSRWGSKCSIEPPKF